MCEVGTQYSGSRGRARSSASPIHRLERSVSYYDCFVLGGTARHTEAQYVSNVFDNPGGTLKRHALACGEKKRSRELLKDERSE